MKNLLLYSASIYLASALRAQVVEGRSHSEMRSAMLEGFVFEQKPKPIESTVVLVDRSSQAAVDPDTVVMEKMVVYDRNLYWDLASDIKKGRPVHAQSHSKFGTGVYEKDFGKVRAACVTVLYIPIMVGISW